MSGSNKIISRELKRCSPVTYQSETSHLGADQRRQSAAKAHKRSSNAIRKIKFLLDLKMNPEQIAGGFKLEQPKDWASHQTIYRTIRREQRRDRLSRKGKRYR